MTDAASLAGRNLMQVGLTSRDLARSRKFYGEVLGLPFLFEVSDMLFFQLDGLRLMVGLGKPDQPLGGSVVYFNAPDIDTLGPALEARGVAFHGPAHTLQSTPAHDLKLRTFADPDGNALALMGMVAK